MSSDRELFPKPLLQQEVHGVCRGNDLSINEALLYREELDNDQLKDPAKGDNYCKSSKAVLS